MPGDLRHRALFATLGRVVLAAPNGSGKVPGRATAREIIQSHENPRVPQRGRRGRIIASRNRSGQYVREQAPSRTTARSLSSGARASLGEFARLWNQITEPQRVAGAPSRPKPAAGPGRASPAAGRAPAFQEAQHGAGPVPHAAAARSPAPAAVHHESRRRLYIERRRGGYRPLQAGRNAGGRPRTSWFSPGRRAVRAQAITPTTPSSACSLLRARILRHHRAVSQEAQGMAEAEGQALPRSPSRLEDFSSAHGSKSTAGKTRSSPACPAPWCPPKAARPPVVGQSGHARE